MYSRTLAILLTSATLAAYSLPAQAIEAAAAAQAFGDALVKGTGGKASFASATQEGANVVIGGLALTSHDSSDTVTFGNTVLEGVTEGGEGVFSAPSVAMSEGVISGENAGTIESASLTNVTVLEPQTAAAAEATPKPGMLFDKAEALDIAVGPNDKPFKVTVSRATVNMSNVVDNAPQASTGQIEAITIPPEAFAEADFKPEMLGYGSIVLGVTWDGVRDSAANVMTLNDLTLSMENGGSLTVSGKLGNLPEPSVMQREKQAAAASEIVVHSVRLSYKDESLTAKILDLQAQKQGVTREQYAQQITGALPFLLAALNNPQFQNQVSTALGAFLQNPGSLTIEVAPETPVTGAEIRQIVGTAPQTLPDRLKATVTANQ